MQQTLKCSRVAFREIQLQQRRRVPIAHLKAVFPQFIHELLEGNAHLSRLSPRPQFGQLHQPLLHLPLRPPACRVRNLRRVRIEPATNLRPLLRRQFRDSFFDFSDCAHGQKIARHHIKRQRAKGSQPPSRPTALSGIQNFSVEGETLTMRNSPP